MRHPENAQPDIDNVVELSDLTQELRLLKQRISILEASVFNSSQNRILNVPVGYEQESQITVQRQQGANIAIAIRSPSTRHASVFSSALPPMSIPTASPPMPTASPPIMPTASPPMPILTSSPPTPPLSWGPMMTPSEVQELLAPEPQTGEYYVITKGRRPGVYLSWSDAHELIDGLKSPCHWKKNDKHAALGQYTLAYNNGKCECRSN